MVQTEKDLADVLAMLGIDVCWQFIAGSIPSDAVVLLMGEDAQRLPATKAKDILGKLLFRG